MTLKNFLRLLCCLYSFSITSSYTADYTADSTVAIYQDTSNNGKLGSIVGVKAFGGGGPKSTAPFTGEFTILMSSQDINQKRVNKLVMRPIEEKRHRNFTFGLTTFCTALVTGIHKDKLSIPSFLRPSNGRKIETLTISDKPMPKNTTTDKQSDLAYWLMAGACCGTAYFGIQWLLATYKLSQQKQKYGRIHALTEKAGKALGKHLMRPENRITLQHAMSQLQLESEEDKVTGEQTYNLCFALTNPQAVYPIIKEPNDNTYHISQPTMDQLFNMTLSKELQGDTRPLTLPSNIKARKDHIEIYIAKKPAPCVSEFASGKEELIGNQSKKTIICPSQSDILNRISARRYVIKKTNIPAQFTSSPKQVTIKKSWRQTILSPFSYLYGWGRWLIGRDKK